MSPSRTSDYTPILPTLRLLAEAMDGDTAWDRLDTLRADLGFDYCGLGLIGLDSNGNADVVMHHATDRFDEAVKIYKSRGLDVIDPVARLMASGTPLAIANDVLDNVSASQRVHADAMRSFLTKQGFPAHASLAINLPFESSPAFLAFGSYADQPNGAYRRMVRESIAYWNLGAMAYANALINERQAAPSSLLTPTEHRVLSLLASGQRLREIAESENKSFSTVRRQADEARRRLGARTTAQAIRMACELGIL